MTATDLFDALRKLTDAVALHHMGKDFDKRCRKCAAVKAARAVISAHEASLSPDELSQAKARYTTPPPAPTPAADARWKAVREKAAADKAARIRLHPANARLVQERDE